MAIMDSHPRVREDKVVKIALKQCIMWLTEKLVLISEISSF